MCSTRCFVSLTDAFHSLIHSAHRSVPLADQSCPEDQHGARNPACTDGFLKKEGGKEQGGDRIEIAHHGYSLRLQAVRAPEVKSIGDSGVDKTDDQDQDRC